jgi:EAL domain-containing protein (putative c-di-GMP-specific phosphodiesterase class I)
MSHPGKGPPLPHAGLCERLCLVDRALRRLGGVRVACLADLAQSEEPEETPFLPADRRDLAELDLRLGWQPVFGLGPDGAAARPVRREALLRLRGPARPIATLRRQDRLDWLDAWVLDQARRAAAAWPDAAVAAVNISPEGFRRGALVARVEAALARSGLPVDAVTLDRCFAADIAGDARLRTVLRAVVDLAHALGIRVCVEGTERPEPLAAALAAG